MSWSYIWRATSSGFGMKLPRITFSSGNFLESPVFNMNFSLGQKDADNSSKIHDGMFIEAIGTRTRYLQHSFERHTCAASYQVYNHGKTGRVSWMNVLSGLWFKLRHVSFAALRLPFATHQPSSQRWTCCLKSGLIRLGIMKVGITYIVSGFCIHSVLGKFYTLVSYVHRWKIQSSRIKALRTFGLLKRIPLFPWHKLCLQ